MKIIRFLAAFGIIFFIPQSSTAYTIIHQREAVSKSVLRIVFCPLHYENNRDLLNDIGIITKKLFKLKPFSEFEGKIAFSYLELSLEEERLIFKPVSAFPPLLVRQDFIDGLNEKFGPAYKLAIIDAKSGASCAELSQIDKTSLLIIGRTRYSSGNSFAKGFLHELGHSLGLREEFINAEHNPEPGYPNCATTKKEAQDWWGDLVGGFGNRKPNHGLLASRDSRVNYISGCCGNKNYIRPTIASLMNDADKAEDFGPVNERYLRKVLRER